VAITNALRILKLPEPVIEMIKNDILTAGHARAILQVDPSLQIDFANYIVKNELSVHNAEEISKKFENLIKEKSRQKGTFI